MSDSGFSPWPCYTDEEIQAVSSVLRTNKVNYWTGEHGREFEKEFSVWAGTRYAIALANGTLALELAFRGLGIGDGDEVVVTPRSFIASVSSIVTCGAVPVFADVSATSQNITAESVRAVLTPKTRAIVCVHLAGWPCEMDEIMALADELGLFVIEDCAQAHGAMYRGRSVGGFGHVAAWSFCQDKIITTGGEGGMVTTNEPHLWEKMWSYKDHGKSFESVFDREHTQGFRWLHDSFGSNMRLTEMQAAIGRIQLERMPEWHLQRKRNAEIVLSACKTFPDALRVPEIPEYIDHAWYKCYVFVKSDGLAGGWSRDRIMAEITALGVPCYTGSCPEIYMEKAFDGTPYKPAQRLPVARELGETSLMFLVHPTLTHDAMIRTSDVLTQVMRRACR